MATVKTKEALDRAEAQFRKRELAAREGEAVRAEHAAAHRAFDVKTARLKSLRLAKAAADEESAASAAKAARESAGACAQAQAEAGLRREAAGPKLRAPRRYPTGAISVSRTARSVWLCTPFIR